MDNSLGNIYGLKGNSLYDITLRPYLKYSKPFIYHQLIYKIYWQTWQRNPNSDIFQYWGRSHHKKKTVEQGTLGPQSIFSLIVK